MTHRTTFIATICAAPDDDAPRLVFADWLEEHGEEERAEFIRVQCELAAIRKAKGLAPDARELPDGALRLWDREAELWDQCLIQLPPAWTAALDQSRPEADGMAPFAVAYVRRGFVDEVVCRSAGWLAHHAALAWHPDHCEHECSETAQPIRTVRLTTGISPFHIGQLMDEVGDKLPPDADKVIPWLNRAGRYDLNPAPLLKLRWPWLTVELPAERLELQARRLNVQVDISDELLRAAAQPIAWQLFRRDRGSPILLDPRHGIVRIDTD